MKKMIPSFNISINSVLFVILVLLFLSYLGIIKIYHKETRDPAYYCKLVGNRSYLRKPC